MRDWLPLNWLCRGWCVCLWSLGLSGVLWAEEISWPRWRGTTGLGVAPNNALPEAWSPDQLKPLWQATLGTGWSSPVVDAGVVVVTDRIEARERTLAFDADSGRLRWTREHPIDFDPHAVGRRHGSGPKSTPLIDQGRVYSLGIAGWLECCELATGRSLWQVNFPAEYGQRQPLPDGRAFVDGETCVVVPVGNGQGAPVPLFGYTGSLTLWGERLIAPVGGARAGTIQAFDTRTGRVVWRALTENVSYSSPIVATLGDVPQVVVMTGPRVVGLDLVDGRLLWSHPFQIQYDESIGTPLVVGQRVIVSGDGHPATALDIERVGSSWNVRVAWENFDATSYLSSGVVRDGHLYAFGGGGDLHAVRLADGMTLWSGGDHGFYCTPLIVGDRLVALNEQGVLSLLQARPQAYRTLGQTTVVDTATWTTPALSRGRLYVRGHQTLRALNLN